ncbi:MAG: translation elongation factor Ts [Clostridia bacterium]|jgi:elongation factor Ts|nr:translation elongation factor Ts [Clostridia bacterium]NLF35592.1 translation elongation factor Ts [Clostridiaceae bacterium]MDD3093666.1 translation elongation factor Ts [Clostridia bacterium]MDD3972376.1 translation elongation factor Ts [Clostridia bacterium]MDD4544126.1 translation elongation factor Ts [Clostridia bacterium]
MISASAVKELREKTGVGMMECKKALVESNGDFAKAVDILRERGLANAQKKSGRIAAEGVVGSYIHGGGRIGVLVEVNIETDFAAKNEDFLAYVKDIAMQIAASKPEYVRREEIPAEIIEKEKAILKSQALNEGKPEKVVEKMIEGRIEKFYKQVCLLDQAYIRNPDISVQQMTNEIIAKIGENISVRRFTRYEMGEGLQKREENFADEVAKQISK